jgi:hypothetical protein
MSVPKTRECPLDSRTRQISTLIFCQNFCDHVNKRSPKNTMNEMQMKSAPPSALGRRGMPFWRVFFCLFWRAKCVRDGDKMTTIRVSGPQEGTSRRINPFTDFALAKSGLVLSLYSLFQQCAYCYGTEYSKRQDLLSCLPRPSKLHMTMAGDYNGTYPFGGKLLFLSLQCLGTLTC